MSRSAGAGADGARSRVIGYQFSDVQATRLPLQAISRVKGSASRGVRHSSFVISPITQQ
jgi:hypothetical protein